MSLTIKTFQGQHIQSVLTQAAQIFVDVFREYPYLYGGNLNFEIDYLQNYLNTPDSALFIVYDGSKAVGASSCIPLEAEDSAFYKPIESAGYNVHEILYLGESALYPAYRGQGLGVKFFELRENHALTLANRNKALFCRVLRDDNHPARPDHYVPLDGFWRNRGYQPLELYTAYAWQDIGDNEQTFKTMAYWMKHLNP